MTAAVLQAPAQKRAPKRVLPGFRLTLGYTLFYLALIVLLPLSALIFKTFTLTLDQFWAAVASPRVVASYQLTFGASFLAALPVDVAVTVLGVGSNLLVRDGGVRGVVIRLMRGFTGIAVEGNELVSGAGAPDLNVALTARDHGLAGLEFLSGIPGTIGGAIAMNGGAYGGELAHVLVSAEAVDRRGVVHHVAAADLGFSYRHSAAPADWVFTSARLRAKRSSYQPMIPGGGTAR
mgnify:CR=1 FL=1